MKVAWLLWLLLVSSHDFFQRRVPNWLIVAGALLAIAALAIDSQPFGVSWLGALSASTLAFLIFLAFYSLKLMGAGDVKFAAALGLWIGIKPILIVWIGSSLIAGLHALLLISIKRWSVAVPLMEKLSHTQKGRDIESKVRQTPYAAYMAITSIAWVILDK